MKTKEPKKKMGRPPKEISKSIFEELCKIQCTEEEIAGVFSCSVDTIYRFCKKTYDNKSFADVFKQFSSHGKSAIRRQQFHIMNNGNAAMAIWLGKQYLGQREQPEITVYDGGEALTPDERARMTRIKMQTELTPLDNLCESNK
jgi:hypothetical protein